MTESGVPITCRAFEREKTMIEIISYSEEYDELIKALDTVTFYSIKYHQDVIKDSVCLAMNGRQLVGVGMLKAGATFLKVDLEDLRYYFIHADFFTDDEVDVESQVMASAMMLEDLKDSFNEIQDRYPGKRLILRLWCSSEKNDYLEFLMSYGFRPMRVTPVLARTLDGEDENVFTAKNSNIIELKNGERLEIREMNPYDETFAREYILTNREAFEVEDSMNELRFVMGGEDSHVFAVMKGERVIAAVTTWLITDERASTENIFCAEDYRNMGITTAMLQYVFGFLKSKGYSVASLTVFGDNQPATQLYFKLGYEVEGTVIECHYERDYRNIGY